MGIKFVTGLIFIFFLFVFGSFHVNAADVFISEDVKVEQNVSGDSQQNPQPTIQVKPTFGSFSNDFLPTRNYSTTVGNDSYSGTIRLVSVESQNVGGRIRYIATYSGTLYYRGSIT